MACCLCCVVVEVVVLTSSRPTRLHAETLPCRLSIELVGLEFIIHHNSYRYDHIGEIIFGKPPLDKNQLKAEREKEKLRLKQKELEKKAKKGQDIVDPGGEAMEGEEQGGAEVIDLMKILKQRLGASGRAVPKPAAKAPRARRGKASRPRKAI